MTETRPETAASPSHEVESTPAFIEHLGTGDHKAIGRLWIAAGSVFLLAGLIIGSLAGFEGADLSSLDIAEDADQFTQLWSLGRVLVMFGALVPIFVGLATYLVPLQVGASALAFSRGAAAAFWTWLISTGVLILSYVMNGGPSGGQTDYVVMWALALGAMLAAMVWAMICVATTVLAARAAGMTLDRVPVSTWAFLMFSLVGIVALPVVMAELLIAFFDVRYGYLPTDDSRIVLVSVMWSVSLAPAVYWLAIPTLGIAVEAIAVHTGRNPRFHRSVLVALGVLAVLSFGGDLFSFAARGRPVVFDNAVLVVATAAAVLPMLSVLGFAGESLKTGQLKLRTPLVAGLLAGLVTVLAAVLSLLGLVGPVAGFIEDVGDTTINLDSAWNLTDTVFLEGIRALVVGGAVLGAIAGVHHWAHKIWGRSLDDRLGLLATLAAVGGSLVWGVSLVVAGFLEEPVLPAIDDDPQSGVEALNLISGVGAVILAAGAALLLLNVLGAFAGRGSAVEPWRGATLEWATASPPPIGNFSAAPVVHSAYPLLDDDFVLDSADSGIAADEIEAGEEPADGDDGEGEA